MAFDCLIHIFWTTSDPITTPQAGQTSAVEGLEKRHGEKSETEEGGL